LSGTVEVDETYIGGEKPGNRGRGAVGKVLVVVTVELIEGRIGRGREVLSTRMDGEAMDDCSK